MNQKNLHIFNDKRKIIIYLFHFYRLRFSLFRFSRHCRRFLARHILLDSYRNFSRRSPSFNHLWVKFRISRTFLTFFLDSSEFLGGFVATSSDFSGFRCGFSVWNLKFDNLYTICLNKEDHFLDLLLIKPNFETCLYLLRREIVNNRWLFIKKFEKKKSYSRVW